MERNQAVRGPKDADAGADAEPARAKNESRPTFESKIIPPPRREGTVVYVQHVTTKTGQTFATVHAGRPVGSAL